MPWPVHVLLTILTLGAWIVIWAIIKMIKA